MLAPVLLGFLTLTGLPIMVTPFVADARGDAPGWAVIAPIGAMTIVSLVLLVRLLSTVQRQHPPQEPA